MIRNKCCCLLVLVALFGSATNGMASPASKAIILSWDGAADWIVDRLLEEGKLPNVARLARMGARAEYSTPNYPSVTAAGHATLWTGAYSDVHGVTGNGVGLLPRADHTMLEGQSGFDARALRAEPIWVTAAKAGKRVVSLSATQSMPIDPTLKRLNDAKVPLDRYLSFSGFESRIADGKSLTARELQPAQDWDALPPHKNALRECVTKAGEQSFYLLAYDDPNDKTDGLDTLLIRQGSRHAAQATATATLKPMDASPNVRSWSPSFRVTKGNLFGYTYFRLFSLSPDGKQMTLYRRAAHSLQGASTTAQREEYLKAYGGFYDSPFETYSNGEFGKTLWQEGDGTAERRLIELVRLDCEFLKRGTRFAWSRWKPDLLLHYAPMTDGAGHTWMGVLDPDTPRYNPALARKIMPFYEQVFQLQDEWLGAVLDMVGQETVVCLVSDHGMAGVGKQFSPARFLIETGFATTKQDGSIDLTRTAVFTLNNNELLLSVNGTDRKGGIVPPEERESLIQQLTQVLLSATDPDTGKHIVTRVFRPEETAGLGIGGEAGGDLYYDVAPGYDPAELLPTVVQNIASPIGGGSHGFYSGRRKMQAIWYIGGAGVRQGVKIGGVHQTDIAPTLSHLLGIPPPANAVGHCIGEVLR